MSSLKEESEGDTKVCEEERLRNLLWCLFAVSTLNGKKLPAEDTLWRF